MPATARLSPSGAQQFVERYRTFLTDTSKEKGRRDERAVAQRFWDDFFLMVCGVGDTLLAGIEYQYPVRKASTDTPGWIDALWPGVVLIEHKSAGKNLDAAEVQARDYLGGLGRRQQPPVIIVSDFFRFRVVEAITGRSIEFTLDELPDNLARFQAILIDGGVGAAQHEEVADAKAAELMADLYIAFQEAGYDGHEVSIFLVRCLFLLFGDDTGLWRTAGEFGLFGSIVADSNSDGSGLGGSIQELFEALDMKREERPRTVRAPITEFPYVNGGLFASDDRLPTFSFSAEMREALLAACAYDWSSISPAIFGAMFQDIKNKDARRALGEHYTSEQNIMKVIGPLFLDGFSRSGRQEWDSAAGLRRFQRELPTYTFLDPACGCGNFLLVAYKRLRELELKVAARIMELTPKGDQRRAMLGDQLLYLRLSQFHGIEMVDWSCSDCTGRTPSGGTPGEPGHGAGARACCPTCSQSPRWRRFATPMRSKWIGRRRRRLTSGPSSWATRRSSDTRWRAMSRKLTQSFVWDGAGERRSRLRDELVPHRSTARRVVRRPRCFRCDQLDRPGRAAFGALEDARRAGNEYRLCPPGLPLDERDS